MWGTLLLMLLLLFQVGGSQDAAAGQQTRVLGGSDMPEGTPLADTGNMAHVIAERLRRMPEVTAAQIYVGTARPFDFNGMVRHYYLRQSPWQAEVQLQLLNKTDRSRSSHQIAVDAREQVKGAGGRYACTFLDCGNAAGAAGSAVGGCRSARTGPRDTAPGGA